MGLNTDASNITQYSEASKPVETAPVVTETTTDAETKEEAK